MYQFGLGGIDRLVDAQSRAITPENPTGEKGKGGMATPDKGTAGSSAADLGVGWKVNPFIVIPSGETSVLADINGSGVIQHIWLTPTGFWRNLILRFYWDGCETPAVECPVGDFFASGWNTYAATSSLAVCVNPGSAFNCYWPMPFRKHCRITMENTSELDLTIYYQIDYEQRQVADDCAYFYAQFRRVNPQPYKEVYTLLDVKGHGHYVGTYMAWGVNNNGWWGEGEMKFYLDGDKEFPTICGTGLEDYFCGSYNFEHPEKHCYETYNTPYAGLNYVSKPDGLYNSQQRFGMYRWHLCDPIRFQNDIRVTVQALGWRRGRKYLPLQDDIASVSYWYMKELGANLYPLPDKDYLEII